MKFYIEQVVYDKSILQKLGNKNAVIKYWNDAETHLQARYCHITLGTKIRIQRIGNFEYFDKKIVASDAGLETVRDNAKKVIGSADLVVYIAHDETSSDGTIGIAWSPVVCEPSEYNSQKTSINEWRPNALAFGGVSTKITFHFEFVRYLGLTLTEF